MKKIISLMLVSIMAFSPFITIAEIEKEIGGGSKVEIDTITKDDSSAFIETVSNSWEEAKGIWASIYIPIWNRWIRDWWFNVVSSVEGWIEQQVQKLKDSFRRDKREAEQAIRDEIDKRKEEATKNFWDMILEKFGLERKKDSSY